MKGKKALGLVTLFLWAVIITIFITFTVHAGRNGANTLDLWIAAGLLAMFLALCLFLSKTHRVATLLSVAVTALSSFGLRWLGVPAWAALLLLGGCYFILALYLTAQHRRRRTARLVKTLNAATKAYRDNHDCEAYLAALERCDEWAEERDLVTASQMGTVSLPEYLTVLQINTLADMGCWEDRRRLIQELREDTERSGLLTWLDHLEAQGQADAETNPPENG